MPCNGNERVVYDLTVAENDRLRPPRCLRAVRWRADPSGLHYDHMTTAPKCAVTSTSNSWAHDRTASTHPLGYAHS